MKIIENHKKIDDHRRIGLYTSLAGLVILIGGFVLSLPPLPPAHTTAAPANPIRLALAYGALLAGLIISQLGIHYGNHWFRSSRTTERLNLALKGLDDRYTLYHYMTAVPHLLAGPSGLWVLAPQYHNGAIHYENNRFYQKGVLLPRLFNQPGIERSTLEVATYQQDFQRFLKTQLNEGQIPPIQPVLVFVNSKVTVQAADSPIVAVSLDQLKDVLEIKEQVSEEVDLLPVTHLLPIESIT